MAGLRSNAVGRLATVAGVSLNIATKQTLYTVPTGKTAVVTEVIVRQPSATAAALDASFGGNAAANDFRSAVQFDNLVATTDAISVRPDPGTGATPVPGPSEIYPAGTAFGIDVGTTGAVTVTIDVFGFLF